MFENCHCKMRFYALRASVHSLHRRCNARGNVYVNRNDGKESGEEKYSGQKNETAFLRTPSAWLYFLPDSNIEMAKEFLLPTLPVT